MASLIPGNQSYEFLTILGIKFIFTCYFVGIVVMRASGLDEVYTIHNYFRRKLWVLILLLFSRNKVIVIVFICYTLQDQLIASIARQKNAFVLSGDSDFCILSRGLILCHEASDFQQNPDGSLRLNIISSEKLARFLNISALDQVCYVMRWQLLACSH